MRTDPVGDKELKFVAAAPSVARALNAILNLDLGQEAAHMVRTEIRRHALGRAVLLHHTAAPESWRR